MKNIYLHIGSMKTGSTALQYFFSINQKWFLEKGYNYIDIARKAGNYNAFCLLDETPPFVHHKLSINADILYSKIIEEINSSSSKNFIISSEAFYLVSTDLFLGGEAPKKIFNYLSKIRGDFVIKIIIYYRRQDVYVESLYNQFIKTHNFFNLYKGSIEEFVEDKYSMLDYYKITNYWSDVFGKGNIIVREYQKGTTDTIKDFMQLLNIIPNQTLEIPPRASLNESLNYKALKIMLNLNKFNINKKTSLINSELVHLLNETSNNSSNFALLNDVQREKLMQSLVWCNNMLWNEYFMSENKWSKQIKNTTHNYIEPDMEDLYKLVFTLWNKLIDAKYQKNN